MSVDVGVETNALGRAGQQMILAAQGVEGANPSADLAGIATAVPGSQSATAAATLTTTWLNRFTTWKTDAHTHGTGMVDSSATYVAVDEDAAARQGQP